MVIRWAAEMFGFSPEATGLLVTGSSMANFIAILTATRNVSGGQDLRQQGVGGRRLVGYAGESAHGCVARAFDMAGWASRPCAVCQWTAHSAWIWQPLSA